MFAGRGGGGKPKKRPTIKRGKAPQMETPPPIKKTPIRKWK